MKKTWIEKYYQPRDKTIKILDKDFADMKAGEKDACSHSSNH